MDGGENDLGPDAGGYKMAQIDGDDVAGIGPQQTPGPPYWTTYISVDDADDTTKKVEAAGGPVLVPGDGRHGCRAHGVFMDPNGAAFSVWQARRVMARIASMSTARCVGANSTRGTSTWRRSSIPTCSVGAVAAATTPSSKSPIARSAA